MTTIVIPYRDDGHRAEACRVVANALRGILPGAEFLLADSGHEPFNRAASRNLGVRNTPGHEVVVVCDADTLPDPHPLRTAVTEAATDGYLHYPFTICHYLTPAGSELVLAGEEPNPTLIEHTIPMAQGGIMVMLAAAWLACGGMDERFTGWGYEDNAWHATVLQHLGPPVRHSGVVWHLHHPHERYTGSSDEHHNLELACRHDPFGECT